MLGYVEAFKSELKLREFEIYRGYYCGLCKTLGSEYGQIYRKGLSYDMAFLAIFLESLELDEDELNHGRCLVHPITKVPLVHNQAVTYASDMMIILAYNKLLDDIKDGEKAAFSKKFFDKAYAKACGRQKDASGRIEKRLDAFYKLEDNQCDSPDKMAEAFSQVMRVVFVSYFDHDTDTSRIAGEFALNLGKWIYIVDAIDDMEKDIKEASYNPFILMHQGEIDSTKITKSRQEAELMLYSYLQNAMKAYDLLEIKKNKGILDNILFLGLRHQSDQAIRKVKREQGYGKKSI